MLLAQHDDRCCRPQGGPDAASVPLLRLRTLSHRLASPASPREREAILHRRASFAGTPRGPYPPLMIFARPALRSILVLAVSFLTAGALAMATESNYAPTEVDVIEVKELPAARVMEAVGGPDYFEGRNGPFMTLFDYIRTNDLAMTVPVEADPRPARMRFFVERDRTGELPTGEGGVKVYERPAQQVVSIGQRGSYSRENYDEGLAKLRAWLAAHPEFQASGEPYAVYWDGPFKPWFLKRAEVHIPVERAR